jgi:hypothetical protein
MSGTETGQLDSPVTVLGISVETGQGTPEVGFGAGDPKLEDKLERILGNGVSNGGVIDGFASGFTNSDPEPY